MEKGYININENEINDITGYLSRNQFHASNIKDETKTKFNSLFVTNLFGNGIKKITNQLANVSEKIGRVNQVVKNKTNEMFEIDNKFSNDADAIEIPMDFVSNDSIKNHIFDGITLNKKDGQSVNNNELNQNELKFEPKLNEKKIENIMSNSSNLSNIELKEYKNKNSVLKNINSNHMVEKKILNFMEDGISTTTLKSNLSTSNNTNNIEIISNLENEFEYDIKDEYFYDDFFDNYD